MSIEVNTIGNADVRQYCDRLKNLVRANISLPERALDYYDSIWTVERLSSQIDNLVLLKATVDQEFAGLVLGTAVEGGVGTIIWVIVDEKFQKLGLGSRLFVKACDTYKIRGAHKVKLTVPDRETVEFYLKQGMTLEGEHKNHWWGNDFWSMGFELN